MGRKVCRNRGDLYQSTRLHGRIRWQARSHRSQRSGAHSYGVHFEYRDIGNACRVSKVERPSATRSSHSAWSRCREESPPFPRQANLRSPIKNRCASTPTSRPCRSTCNVGGSSGQTQKLTHTGRRVRSGTEHTEALIGGGSGGEGLQRLGNDATCSAFHAPVPSATHEKSAEGPADSSQGAVRNHQLLHHFGHSRTSPGVVVMVAGPLDEDRIGGFERQRAMLYQICGILEYAAKDKGHGLAWVRPWSDCPAPTLDQTSTCRPQKSQLSPHGTGKSRAGTSPKTTTTTATADTPQ